MTRAPTSASAFDDAVSRLLDSLAQGVADSESYQAVVRGLRAMLTSAYSDVDAEDVVHDAIVRLLQRQANCDAEAIENPAAFLNVTARHLAIDRHRRRASMPLTSAGLEAAERRDPDDEIAALLDRNASDAAVRSAYGRVKQDGDALTARIVTTWLDLADEHGRAPTSREVAKLAEVSHTTVNEALRRFRSYFPQPRPGASSVQEG